MGAAKDYQKDLDRLIEVTQQKADYAAELKSKDTVERWQKRAREVGIRFGEFYDRFMKDPRKLLGAIVELENKRNRH